MSILEELYNGNINPSEKFLKASGGYKKINQELNKHIDELMLHLNDEEKQLFQKIEDNIYQLNYISEKECFIEGFCLGAQIMREILEHKSENFIYCRGGYQPPVCSGG